MNAYHMSLCLHPLGRILKGNGEPKVDKAIEEALEKLRPATAFSRFDSVYSREVTDFTMLGLDSGYIYRVAPRGDCQRHDARWIGCLQKAHLKPKHAEQHPDGIGKLWPDWTDDFVASICAKYWCAVASDEPLWELLSHEAEITAQLSDSPIKASATKGGWQPSAETRS